VVKLPFHATAGAAPRFKTSGLADADAAKKWTGRWRMGFDGDSNAAVMDIQAAADGVTTGTILAPTGDYGFLEGAFSYFHQPPEPPAGSLKLSSFDGAHAFLIVGALEPDGATLKGDFWSGDTFHDTWTAKRDDAASLPDAFSQTQFSEGAKLDGLKFPDLDGTMRSLSDPAFAGKARIIEVFGSWCPNCNDASRYLGELHRKYKGRGLSIVGLAFEYTGDFQRDAEQVKEFAKYHGTQYPLLLAGVADREKASAALPIIDKVRAYPTIILLDGQGKGRAVYTGFSGPATGGEYTRFKLTFEAMIEDLLAR
jgi:thiol-disulfide isomerase/thioredoxin